MTYIYSKQHRTFKIACLDWSKIVIVSLILHSVNPLFGSHHVLFYADCTITYMISFFMLIFSQTIFKYESGTYPNQWKSYFLQLLGWIIIIALSKTLISIIFTYLLYYEVKAFIELSIYPIRNIVWIRIISFDIMIPFIVSSVSNAMCDHFL